jgi:hypothetical protein
MNHFSSLTKLFVMALLTIGADAAQAFGGNPNVTFAASKGAFPLVKNGLPALVVVESTDWPGVARAAKDLQSDLAKVAAFKGEVGPGTPRILVGTLGKSPTIDTLVRKGKLDVRAIQGKWEASITQVVGDTLVVAGADKRGTIFALYDLSESAGVSPWSWWADVPVKRHSDVYVTGRVIAKSPVVKYRGMFINDEAPSLAGWAYANHGGFNHQFYEKVFELLLRLRANYLWPSMWGRAFSVDDPINPKTADDYGIVMGTSHVEPMMRADSEWGRLGFTEKQWNYDKNPAELEKFWTDGINRNKAYENIVTVAMRGKVDTPMSESANVALLEKIVATQRRILAENMNPDVTQIPQLWCLYKEVQEYYEKGMRVPDDITLLWADDNWGDIRRLPTLAERSRKGGSGVYYHFDYVGGPRNYKWIDTNPIPKIWEQMNLAHQYGADRIWIVNVGDIKPMEFPLEFFITMARDPDAMRKEDLQKYTENWAAREFGPKHAKEIAHIISETHRLNGRRKPELISPETYSVENYGEADRVVAEFHDLIARAEAIDKDLPAEYHSAFYQLVIHPVKAPGVVTEMYVAAAKNALYAKAGSSAANVEAQRVRDLFAKDKAITAEYHALNGGKWNHFMDQTHIGYTYWQEPPVDVMPKVVEVTASAPTPIPASPTARPLQMAMSTANSKGFIEKDGVIAIEAEHTSRRISAKGVKWETIPAYGRTLSGVEPFPVLAKSAEPAKGARLEYDLMTQTGGRVWLETVVGPSLAFQPDHGLRIAIAFDDQVPQVVDVAPKYLSHEWETAVSDAVGKVRTEHTLAPGHHVLKVWAIDPGVVVERLVLDLGGLKPSYLGPPESSRLP